MCCNAEFYHVWKIPRTGIGTRVLKMVSFTASCGNNFVGGTCASVSALPVIACCLCSTEFGTAALFAREDYNKETALFTRL